MAAGLTDHVWTLDELMAEFGIKAPDVVAAAERVLGRKKTR